MGVAQGVYEGGGKSDGDVESLDALDLVGRGRFQMFKPNADIYISPGDIFEKLFIFSPVVSKGSMWSSVVRFNILLSYCISGQPYRVFKNYRESM